MPPIDKSRLKQLPLKIGLIGTGLILFELAIELWSRGQVVLFPISLGLSFGVWMWAVILIVLAVTPRPDKRWAWLILVSLIFVQLGYAYVRWPNSTPLTVEHSDNVAIAEFAVEALRNGQNPYSWNFSDIERVYHSRVSVTPFLNGTIQNRFTYPALQILMLYGLNLLGIGQARALSLVFHILVLILLFVGTPKKFRAVVLLPLFMLDEFVFGTIGGIQDIVWSAILVGVILLWARPFWRALLFGLACSFRQQPWLVAPFIIIYLWKEGGTPRERWKRVGYFTGVSLGVFFLINAPFIVWEPTAWWMGAFEPVYARFDVISFGLAAISQFGLSPFPREFYAGLQVSSLLLMLVIHWRHPREVGMAFWIFPAIFFWLYYRSLPSYWLYWIPPLLLVLSQRLGSVEIPGFSIAKRRTRSVRTVAIATVLILATLVFGLVFLQRESSITIGILPPFETIGFAEQLAYRLNVSVTNLSEQILTPRFAVQRDILHAVPWEIESGPERLGPGEAGIYTISTLSPTKAIPAASGGNIVVTDAGGSYRLRGIESVPPDPGIKDPDYIANPNYSYWPSGSDAPRGWELHSEGGSSSAIAGLETIDDLEALTLRFANSADSNALPVLRLSQTISFPDSFTISIYPTANSAGPTEHAYGLELNDGKRRLWILFGESDDLGMRGEDFAYINIRSPLNAWSKQNIELRDLYMLFGWPLPDFTQRVVNGTEFSARQVELSLLSMPSADGQGQAVFGPIEQNSTATKPTSLIAEALEHPDTYYVNVGDEYRRERNFDLAQDSYVRALTYNSLNPGGSFGLAESSFWLGEYDQAIAAFGDSIQQDYRIAESYRGVGWSALALGDAELSEDYFRSAIEADPNFPDAHNGLGWVFIEKDLCEQAVTHFRRALSLDPRFLEAQRGIEECALLEDV